jgi:hypothetical protein
LIGSILAVVEFEWKRSLKWTRLIWWVVLAGFPIFIMGLVRYLASYDLAHQPEGPNDGWRDLWALLIYVLVPSLVCILGTLLWSTPAIATELERRSWVYLAVRPNGGTAVLLGKYLATVTWVIPPALVGLTIATPIGQTGDTFRIWWSMSILVFLSVPAYAAIFLLIGVLMPRRAMVIGVVYTLLFELLLTYVPAMINKITVQYRLRGLASEWCSVRSMRGFSESDRAQAAMFFGSEPVWQHILVLFVMVPVLLGISVLILRTREFSASSESDI